MEIVMAIYHFSAKVISRANGSSALASAAYRSASRLYDQRLDRAHDFTNKSGVIHSEVMTPENVPEEFRERQSLWNEVEAAEKRKDAQLAREVEFAIPRELTREQGIELARDFVRSEFVDRGMIADLNVHWDVGADGEAKPHAHVMLTMRSVDGNGFGAKVREWNRTQQLGHWREAWATHVNERLAELGIEARIDHRSFQDQGIDLEPQHKIGPAAARMAGEGLEPERIEDHREIARENGARIIADPNIALDAITRQQATFTRRDLAMFVHRHSDGLEQFNAVMGAVEGSSELVRLGLDGRAEERFTSREMIAVEERLHRAAEIMAESERHYIHEDHAKRALELAEEHGLALSREQRSALAHVTDGHDLGIVVGYAGSGKSAMLGVAREAWEESGYQVRGVALSGIAAENLESGSGIASRTIAGMEHQWAKGRELLSDKDVLVIDEAGMVGSRQLERVLSEAERQGAKVVLVGDPEQLQAIEAGAAFRSLTERHPHAEVQDIRRQQEAWQQDATRHLATGRTEEALEAYREHGTVHPSETRDEARQHLVEGWERDRHAEPDKTRIILTHTNDEVAAINSLARDMLRDGQDLGLDVGVRVERGDRVFASGDRVMFLKNDRELEVKNGSLGIVESVTARDMTVRLDSGRSVAFDLKDYAHLDHGYAATIHKAQGVTVDRVHVLATPGLDRHAAYVALSRHRENVQVHYGRDDFANDAKLARVLSRERPKDMASDYGRGIERGGSMGAQPFSAEPDRPAEQGREGAKRTVDSERAIGTSELAARRGQTATEQEPEFDRKRGWHVAVRGQGNARDTTAPQPSGPEPDQAAEQVREGTKRTADNERAIGTTELAARENRRMQERAPESGQKHDRRATRAESGIARSSDEAKHTRMSPDRAAERGRERGMFASFRPKTRSPERLPVASQEASAVNRAEAIQRYARALVGVERMEERGLPVLPHQRQAVEKARSALEKLGPHTSRDLDSAFAREPGLVREAAEGRMNDVNRAMRTEAEVRNSPEYRADRFVARWKDLEAQRGEAYRAGGRHSERNIKASMGAMANGLERDPQMESILRNRSRELGIPMERGRSVGQNITAYLGLGRDRELSL
jgi:Ti-type conjugative transfer relaxase TraA